MAPSSYRSRLYKPGQKTLHKISRSGLEFFRRCPRCFYLRDRLGIKHPSMPGWTLNSAVDHLLKKEFDIYRQKQKPHPLLVKNKVKAVPYIHKDLDIWRNPFEGISYSDKEHGFLLHGGIDDIWQDSKTEELIVVDYKATAKSDPVTELGPVGGWHDSYRRQMDVYVWLFRKNDFKVSPTSYFVYANGQLSEDQFSNKLKFETNLIPYETQTDWVDQAVSDIKACLESPKMPRHSQDCEHCLYARSRLELYRKSLK